MSIALGSQWTCHDPGTTGVSFRTVTSNHATPHLVAPVADGDWREARRLIEEYAASLNVDLCFQNFAHEIEHLAQEYGPPAGAFLLAVENRINLGCVGLRRISDDVAEMKRLYAVPAARGRGVGRLLAEGIIDASRGLGYATVVLDTLPSMSEAQSLYATLGFKATSAYRFNPVPGTAYLELKLR
jgi:GNAT superfamily N-acetyltransferase